MLPRRFDHGSAYEGQQAGYDGEAARRDGASGNEFYRGAERQTEYYDYQQRRRSPSPRRDNRRLPADKDASWDSRAKGRSTGSSDWQDDRGRNRHSRTPPNKRLGLLGAAPTDIAHSNMGGQSGVNTQVLAALQAQQTQAWLAALQANQMQMNNSSHLSGQGNYGGRSSQVNRQPAPRPWSARKRVVNQESSGPIQKRKRDDYKSGNRPYVRERDPPRKQPSKPSGGLCNYKGSNAYNPSEPTSDTETNKSTKAIILSELCEEVEQLRGREKIERNISDQDVDKLVLFSFNGQIHKCDVCKVMCKSPASLRQHLLAKKHNLAVIEERADGKDPCREIMDIDLKPDDWFNKNEVARVLLEKQATALEVVRQEQRRKEFEENPANYVKYSVNTRKVAVKEDKSVCITHASEVTTRFFDFTSDQVLFGCEFINTVVGFTCQLCDVLINGDASVLEHVQSRQHKENYKNHLEKNEDYKAKQADSNKALETRLGRYEGKRVLIHEAFESDEAVYLAKIDPKLVKAKPVGENVTWNEVGALVKPEDPPHSADEVPKIGADGEEPAEATESPKCATEEVDEEIDEQVLIEDSAMTPAADAEDSNPDDDNSTTAAPVVELPNADSTSDDQSEIQTDSITAAAEKAQVKEEIIVDAKVEDEDRETKETSPRVPARRATRGGATARRGRGRGTPKSKYNRAKYTVVTKQLPAAATAAPTNEESAVVDGYEVIDEIPF